MPRVPVYLPEELHRAVKELGLAISELSQHAVRTEVRRRELEVETDRYLAELATELGGPPSAEELAEADAWIDDALGTTASGSPPRSPGPGSRRPAPRRRRSPG